MRAFVTQRVDQQEKFKEIKTRLNTLWFFPDAERVILAFQGMHEIAEDDGADVVHLLAAIERLGQPRSAEHYLHVRDKRLDKNNGVIEALREDDLMPADLVVPLVDFSPRENRALERGQRRAEQERARARDEVASHGLDPDAHAPPAKGEPEPQVRSLDDLLRMRADIESKAEKTRQQAERQKAEACVRPRRCFRSRGWISAPSSAKWQACRRGAHPSHSSTICSGAFATTSQPARAARPARRAWSSSSRWSSMAHCSPAGARARPSSFWPTA
jgi:hypothetical protein